MEDATAAIWTRQGHEEGVYSVDMNTQIIASGGDDATIKLWKRCNGDLVWNLQNLHDYIVWNVKLWLDGLFTAGYDCVVNYVNLEYKTSCSYSSVPQNSLVQIISVNKICGPLRWADAIGCDQQGRVNYGLYNYEK